MSKKPMMTGRQFKAGLAKLDIPIIQAERYFGINRRNIQKINSGESRLSHIFAKVMELLLAGKIDKEDLL